MIVWSYNIVSSQGMRLDRYLMITLTGNVHNNIHTGVLNGYCMPITSYSPHRNFFLNKFMIVRNNIGL